MITESLDFIARKGLEVMIAEETNEVFAQFTPDTIDNALTLKIANTPYAKKYKPIGQELSKQNIQHLMDKPLNFRVNSEITPNSAAYNEVWQQSGSIEITISPVTEDAEEFLAAFSKNEPTVEIPIKEIPRFENPEL